MNEKVNVQSGCKPEEPCCGDIQSESKGKESCNVFNKPAVSSSRELDAGMRLGDSQVQAGHCHRNLRVTF